MKKMGIEPDTTLAQALELLPQTFPLFQQLGLCCVNQENEGMTVEALCHKYGVDTDSFLEALTGMVN